MQPEMVSLVVSVGHAGNLDKSFRVMVVVLPSADCLSADANHARSQLNV